MTYTDNESKPLANKNGDILENKMSGEFMQALIEQGKIVIKG